MKKFTFIDLFAGIGGFHLSMHSVGGECVFASELDKFARQTYEANFKKSNLKLFSNGNFNQDITDPKLDYSSIPDFDVLCAGFPCQPFSHAGLKKGFADTRGTLFFNIEEIVRVKKDNGYPPKVLLLENVKGLKNHDKGNTFRTIKNNLNKLGYKVHEKVLNSKNFGVPQNRERIFIVAWSKESFPNQKFIFPLGIDAEGNVIKESNNLQETIKKVQVGDILLSNSALRKLELIEEKSYTISEKLWLGHQRRREQHRLKGNGFGYSLFNENSSYTSTISARYYKDGSEILIDQSHLNKRPRKLHPIEAAKLQGYPVHPTNKLKGEFIIPVSNNQAYKQFGNSVSVPVIKALAKEIQIQLLMSKLAVI
ncbi:DNA (cytosine-5-)-methyltransferase [Maribacter aquivivus]|uniref:DNA (cytosine-5-)-methyltransferase n=1 Tax=Maribacter aquivivus TaxID=228958 RepID=UPI002493BE94|nr:DNA (cytosine-5-)-methyltransferase [Maribacter aquivivus]